MLRKKSKQLFLEIFRYKCLVNKLHKKMESTKGNKVSLQTFQTYETTMLLGIKQ